MCAQRSYWTNNGRGCRVVEQPFKIPFVATIVRVANADNAEAGKAVIEYMSEALQRALHVGDFTNVKLLFRFMACVGDLLGEQGIVPVLEKLVEKLPTYQGDGDEVSSIAVPDVHGGLIVCAQGLLLAIVYIILITIPYAIKSTSKFTNEEATEFLKTIQPFVEVKHPMQSLFDTFGGSTPPFKEERVRGQHVSGRQGTLDYARLTSCDVDCASLISEPPALYCWRRCSQLWQHKLYTDALGGSAGRWNGTCTSRTSDS
jgi:hypothetical protein